MRMRHVRRNAKPLLPKRFYVTDATTEANSHFRLKLLKKKKEKEKKTERKGNRNVQRSLRDECLRGN